MSEFGVKLRHNARICYSRNCENFNTIYNHYSNLKLKKNQEARQKICWKNNKPNGLEMLMLISVLYLLTDLVSGILVSNQESYQENRSFNDAYVDLKKYPGELCNRVCVPGENRVCYYKFTLEHYQALGM